MARRKRSTPPHQSDVIREPSWEERQKQARKAKRRRRRPNPRKIIGPILVLGLGAAVGIVVAGLSGRGPYASLAASREAATTIEPGPTTTLLGGTTTTEFALDGRDYRPGDCVIWDQDAPPAVYHRTDVVPCGEDHIIEIAEGLRIEDPAEGGPTTPGWVDRNRSRCTPVVERYLGAKLDPYGRYSLDVLAPLVPGWTSGDRQLWCGIAASWSKETAADGQDRRSDLLRETVDRRRQFWSYEPGDCLASRQNAPIACTQPHTEEVVGTVTLADDTALPPASDNQAWDDLAGESCRGRARTYLGRSVPDPWQVGWIPIHPESWAAGARTVPCFLGQWEGDELQTVTGSARAQTA